MTTGTDHVHTDMVVKHIGLKKDMILKMFKEIEIFIDDPIAMDRFYLEMRLINDPEMTRHAEDFNLMVLEMVKGTQAGKQIGIGGISAFGTGGHAAEMPPSIGTELLGSDRSSKPMPPHFDILDPLPRMDSKQFSFGI